ncbi:uncharacterized protein [Ptychodera flava]|uniref:uncharacterized protein n=1 Tax=Ptychodera flava TaxID=63121 RepID=UPI00396A81D7
MEDVPSVFKDFAGKFILRGKCDKPVDSQLAEIINGLFRDGIPEEKFTDLSKKFDRPENFESLTTVRVNQLVWDIIRPETRTMDTKFQVIQTSLVKGSTALVKLVQELAKVNTESGSQPDIQKLLDLGTDALALFGYTNRLLNLRRRDCMKHDLKQDYSHLFSTTVPFTDQLFGDDVTKRVKDIQEVNKAGNYISTWQQRGGGRGRSRGRGFRFRGRGRGTGSYQRQYMHDSSKNYQRYQKPNPKQQTK